MNTRQIFFISHYISMKALSLWLLVISFWSVSWLLASSSKSDEAPSQKDALESLGSEAVLAKSFENEDPPDVAKNTPAQNKDDKKKTIIDMYDDGTGGEINSDDGKSLAKFKPSIYMMDENDGRRFYDHSGRLLAQVKNEGGDLNLYDGNHNLLHTFDFGGRSDTSPKNVGIFPTKSDDIILLSPKDPERIIDSYNLRTSSILPKASGQGFVAKGTCYTIRYDSQGKFTSNLYTCDPKLK